MVSKKNPGRCCVNTENGCESQIVREFFKKTRAVSLFECKSFFLLFGFRGTWVSGCITKFSSTLYLGFFFFLAKAMAYNNCPKRRIAIGCRFIYLTRCLDPLCN